jgi:dTDP-4-dehydrorhamnose reductase
VGEVLVKKYSSKSLIIRPGGLVGPGMKKGPIFDILEDKPLWIHPNSTLNIMRTATTARIVLELAKEHLKRNIAQEEFNLTGVSTITLFEASMILNKQMIFGDDLPVYNSTIDLSSNSRSISLPSSKNELIEFYLETTRK